MKELYFSSWGQNKTYVPNRWNKLNLISEDINYYLTALLENDKYLNGYINDDVAKMSYFMELSASAYDSTNSISITDINYTDLKSFYSVENKDDIIYVNDKPFGQNFSSYSHICYNSSTNCYNDNEYITATKCVYDPHTYNKLSFYARNYYTPQYITFSGDRKIANISTINDNNLSKMLGTSNTYTLLNRPQYPTEAGEYGADSKKYYMDFWVNRGIKGCVSGISATYCPDFIDAVNQVPKSYEHRSMEIIPEDCKFHYYGDMFIAIGDRDHKPIQALDTNGNERNDVYVNPTNGHIPLYFDLGIIQDYCNYSTTNEGQTIKPMSAIEEVPYIVQSGISIELTEYSLQALHIDFTLENKPITFSAYSSWTADGVSHKDLHTWTSKPCNVGFMFNLIFTGCYISSTNEEQETVWTYVTAKENLPILKIDNNCYGIKYTSSYKSNTPRYINNNIECDIYFKPDKNVLSYYTGEE